jgi:hypothetical protein
LAFAFSQKYKNPLINTTSTTTTTIIITMMPDGIRSQLEWYSALSTTKAPQPTQATKFLRKVRFCF